MLVIRLFGWITSTCEDTRFLNCFKPTKVALMKLSLASYIQGTEKAKADTAMDFVLFLLGLYEDLDPGYITVWPFFSTSSS